MVLNPNVTFKNVFLSGATSSTIAAEIKMTVPCRAKYMSTLFSIWGTTGGGTSGFDVFAYQNALGGASTLSPTIAIITSGQSVTTTSGNVTFEVGSTLTTPVLFNKGDIIGVSGSTGISGVSGYSFTHILQEI